MKLSLLLASLLLLFNLCAVPAVVSADGIVPDYDCSTVNPDGSKGAKVYGRYNLEGMLDIAQTTIQFILGISGALALLMFFYGGILWLISGGEDARVTQGREALIQATVGLIIILGSWVFVNFVILALSGQPITDTATLFGGQKWSEYSRGCTKITP